MTALRIKHPILRLEVVGPDGARRAQLRVFCQRRRRSVLVEDCCECVHRDAETSGVTPSVECTIPSVSLEPRADAAGEKVAVGVVLRTGIVVVSESAPLGRASVVLREHGRRSVVIVDNNSVVVGTVHDTGLRRRVGAALVGVVRDVMSRPIAVHERTPVRVALKLLAASHLREAAVVSDAGVPLGLFRDVDGLRWIAGARAARTLDSRR